MEIPSNNSKPEKHQENKKQRKTHFKSLELLKERQDAKDQTESQSEVNNYLDGLSPQEAKKLLGCCEAYAVACLHFLVHKEEYEKTIVSCKDTSNPEVLEEKGNEAFNHQRCRFIAASMMRGYELVFGNTFEAKVVPSLRKESYERFQQLTASEDGEPLARFREPDISYVLEIQPVSITVINNLSLLNLIKEKIIDNKSASEPCLLQIQSSISYFTEYVRIMKDNNMLEEKKYYYSRYNKRLDEFLCSQEGKLKDIQYPSHDSLLGYKEYMDELIELTEIIHQPRSQGEVSLGETNSLSLASDRKKGPWRKIFEPLIKDAYYDGLSAGISDALNKQYGEPNRENLTDLFINVLASLETLDGGLPLSNDKPPIAKKSRDQLEALCRQRNDLQNKINDIMNSLSVLDKIYIDNSSNMYKEFKVAYDSLGKLSETADNLDQLQQDTPLFPIFGEDAVNNAILQMQSANKDLKKYLENKQSVDKISSGRQYLDNNRKDVQNELNQLEERLQQLHEQVFQAIKDQFMHRPPNAETQGQWESLKSAFGKFEKSFSSYNKLQDDLNKTKKELEDKEEKIRERLYDLLYP